MPKKKIFFIITILSIVFLTVASVNVRAHPPDDMSLEFNSSTSTLKVTIIHGVSDNTTHYISSVEIRVNGTIDQTQFYSSQPALDVFIYEYTVVTSNVSIIQVTATCIVGGSLTRTLGSTTGPSGGAIPGYLGFYLILTISVVTLIPIIRKKLKRVKI